MYGICNVVGASIPRNTDSGTYIHVGPEIGVASTKAFTGQVTVLMLLALCVGQMRGTVDDATVERIVRELKNMPLYIKDVLGLADKIKNLSKIYTYARNFLYLGRGYNYPTALEGALKLKEISYIHAEGYPAAEMKYIFPFSSKNSNEKTQNKELDKPQSLIIAIYQGRYNTRNDLFRFYTNYTSKKDTFIDLLNVICEVCIESINNQDLSQIIKERCQKVYSVVKPILEEEKEVEYLMNVTGKERDSLMYLHNSSKKLDVSKQEAVIRHLSIIADSIIITKNKLTEENNRNTQSLTLSMIGIILTILFSLLSLLSAENFSALHIYMDYIK